MRSILFKPISVASYNLAWQRSKHTATAVLNELLEMGKIVLPRPPNAVTAHEGICPAILPFTYNISAFRGRSFEERGLLLHYTPPQV
jgi:predicted glycosyltransferase